MAHFTMIRDLNRNEFWNHRDIREVAEEMYNLAAFQTDSVKWFPDKQYWKVEMYDSNAPLAYRWVIVTRDDMSRHKPLRVRRSRT